VGLQAPVIFQAPASAGRWWKRATRPQGRSWTGQLRQVVVGLQAPVILQAPARLRSRFLIYPTL
jgi:hypothetical protein